MTAEHIDRVGVPLIKCNGKYKVAQAYIKVDGAYKLIKSTDVSIKVPAIGARCAIPNKEKLCN